MMMSVAIAVAALLTLFVLFMLAKADEAGESVRRLNAARPTGTRRRLR